MKHSPFTFESISKPEKQSEANEPKPRKKSDPYPGMTDWGREVLKRINALHKALDGKTLA